jgi:5-methylcytosine-specific restriction endonuclease McrA
MATRKEHASRPGRSSSQLCRPTTRVRIYARDGWACVWCGARGRLTLDHFVPRSKGGHNRHSNLITACPKHNFSRQDLPALEFAMKLGGPMFGERLLKLEYVLLQLQKPLPLYLP